MNFRFSFIGWMVLLFAITFSSCSKETVIDQSPVNTVEELPLFSKSEIKDLRNWLNQQSRESATGPSVLSFPDIKFKGGKSESDPAFIHSYLNQILFLNDDIINAKRSAEEYDQVLASIQTDDNIDQNGKHLLYSFIQISREVLTTREAIEVFQKDGTRNPCNCDNVYANYVTLNTQCQVYGWMYPHYCDAASDAYQAYIACSNQQPHCPNGFIFDGANCYSQVHIPQGFSPFIWNGGFYVEQNCSVTTANNCCPGGYTYDGANCHYFGLYFPSDYEPFIWNNTFYVKAKCQ